MGTEKNKGLTFSDYFRKFESKYGDMTPQQITSAIQRTSLYSAFENNPFSQNTRIKRISSIPFPYQKNEIVEFLKAPYDNEVELRQVSHSLEYTAYPYFKLRKTYQDLLTYRYYTYPCFIEEDESKKKDFLREWKLTEKIEHAIRPSEIAHEIAGHCLRDGKAFYILRSQIDKSHNSVPYAFLQQLPQDYVKIVGFNNVTKYTVAFNLMYFEHEGADPRQFGDLFIPYLNDYIEARKPKAKGKTIYASKQDKIGFDLSAIKANSIGDPEVYVQNGKWFWWVTLPADVVWTFEIDDINRNVTPPFAGLILSMAQIAQYENLQLELLSNPLVSVLTGEMESQDTNGVTAQQDAYKLSPSGRAFFEALWYQMMRDNNTSGIGFFAAPLKNMRLEQLSEAPSATEISSKGYAYTIMKSGNSLIPATNEPKVGTLVYSAKFEPKFAECVYRTFERLMDWVYQSVGFKYDWRFKMFGDVFSEKEELENCRAGMNLGILLDTLRYDAIMGHTILDDISISNSIINLGLVERRRPLKTSYTMSDEKGDTTKSTVDNRGGRPTEDFDEIESDGSAESIDSRGQGEEE